MKFLIGDIGNTSTKICVLNNDFKILRSYNFETIKMSKGNLLKTITRKKIIPITIGEIIFPKKIPNLNQILFNGDNIFEFIKPKIKKIKEMYRDQYLIFSSFING